jgi:hypothetical protein
MKKVLALLVAVASLTGSAGCKKAAGPNTPAAKEMLSAFLKDGADYLALTQKLRPQPADYDAVFVGDAAQKAKAALEPMWDGLKAGLKPNAGETELNVYTATVDDLKKGAPGCPNAYKDVADKINPKMILYCYRFSKPGTQGGQTGDGLFFVNDHWALFPKVWKVIK